MTRTTSASDPRRRIVETALRLFYRQGYLATGINQIIAEAGVAKASFYHHFPSKEDLCVAYLRERHSIWMGWLRTAVENQREAHARVLALFDFVATWMADCGYRGCAFLNIASEVPLLDSRIRAEVISHKDALREYIRTLITKAVFPPATDMDLLADRLYVVFEGAIVACQNYGSDWPALRAKETAELLLDRR